MLAYSHRDRRAYRTVWRGWGAVSAAVLALSILVMLTDQPVVGILGVAGLLVTGVAAVAWGHRVLEEYSYDLRSLESGSVLAGFLRAEGGSSFTLDRAVGRPTERSPNLRPRQRGGSPQESEGLERRGDGN